MEILRLTGVPESFGDFLAEMIPEYRGLYGEAAAVEFEQTAEKQIGASLAHPSVVAFGAQERGRVVGMVMGRLKGEVGEVVFIHLLEGYNDSEATSDLLGPAFRRLKELGARRLMLDTIPLCSFQGDAWMRGAGFECVERMLMSIGLGSVECRGDAGSEVCMEEDWVEGAGVLCRAFRGKRELLVYEELGTLDAAQSTLRQYRSGAYGRVESDWARVSRDGDDLRGIILGTGISSEVGFIFQVAVEPRFQGHGVGTRLMGDLLEVYRGAGMDRAMLGVTLGDGAHRLYTRIGFRDVRLVQVYVFG